MTSQPEVGSGLEVFESNSYIRGYHAYRHLWTPQVREMLLLKREPTNPKDSAAVSVKTEDEIVRHVPYNVASLLSSFLNRDCNKIFVEITGTSINRGAGYGMEVPCIYRLYGPQKYVLRLKECIEKLQERGLI